jgi:hypothetical protein
LQELLVKGGYISANEAIQHAEKENFDQRMGRAAEVFYEYVLNYSPELLSPQYDSFYSAALKKTQACKEQIGELFTED